MPLFHHRYLQPAGELGIWHINEPEAFFWEHLSLSVQEQADVNMLKGHRRLEWLAGRYLLHLMSGRKERVACIKDEHGKPFLEHSDWHISMSHSRQLAAIIAAPVLVGIDIQRIVEKIARIAHKYMRDEEYSSLKPDSLLPHLHVYWGAKEALYKAYGRRQLDFKTHILIDPFQFKPAGGHTTGQVIKDNTSLYFDVFYELVNDYVLVYAMERIATLPPETR